MDLSIQILISLGGVVAAVASTLAIDRAKISALEEKYAQTIKEISEFVSSSNRRFENLKAEYDKWESEENVKVALLESNQAAHAKELAELKLDIKTIMANVQEIKEVILKKGDL